MFLFYYKIDLIKLQLIVKMMKKEKSKLQMLLSRNYDFVFTYLLTNLFLLSRTGS